jgi:hypothetical protein
MNFKTLDDLKKKEERGGRPADFYTGGGKSGLAVESPDDVKNILMKAKENTRFEQPEE